MTRWNQFAGTAIIPTIARLVLALAFITIGLNKIAGEAEFTEAQATTLRDELGVELKKVVATPAALTTWQRAEPDDPQAEPTDEEDKPPQGVPAEDEAAPSESNADADAPSAAEQAEQAADKAAEAMEDAAEQLQDQAAGELIEVPDDAGGDGSGSGSGDSDSAGDAAGTTYNGRAVLKLTLLLHSKGMPNPVLLSWLAALTEFGGGILILIGLFSRVWGLGLAITMAMAFYLTTMERYFSMGPFDVAAQADHTLYNTVFSQLGLGLAALTVFLVGPGPLSLDRLIFRPRKEEIVEEQPQRIERPRNEPQP